MNIRNLIIASIVACVATAPSQASTPEVTNVTMTQGGSGRLVTITYRLTEDAVVTLDVQTNATPNAATGWASIGGAAICNAQGAVWRKVTSADADGNGNCTITWRPDLSWVDEFGNGFKIADGCAKAVVTAWSLDNTPNYMVVDISSAAEPNTQKYYPAADLVPGGVTNGLYKTTTLLMRKIMAKDVTWTMGSTTLENQNRQAAREATHQVKLANNYYIGVYEITQSQWSQVATNNTTAVANFTTERFMRPMEKVCYNEIRNAANSTTANAAYNWPNDPNPSSFLGLLRSKTGIDFDLPSEAQWEFAARAGNGVGYWGDGSGILNAALDANLNLLGRYLNNPTSNSSTSPAATISPSEGGSAIVGSYLPNAWGIYDMHGNVWEWCLDWYEDNINAHGGAVNIDPSAPAKTLSGASGADRVTRGGSWYGAAGICRPAYRGNYAPTTCYSLIGFRVLCSAGLQ